MPDPAPIGHSSLDLGHSGAAAAAPGLLFSHAGPFTQDVVVARGQFLRRLPGLTAPARHRLFSAFVELAQNIARYSAEQDGLPGAERGVGLVVLHDAGDHLLLVSENPVAPADTERLGANLASLAPLDPEALKALHRDHRRSPPPPGSLGAGLGLIDLHRHACAPVRHEFRPRPGRAPILVLSIPLARA